LLAQAHDEAQDTEFLAGNGAGAVDLQDFPSKIRQANMTIFYAPEQCVKNQGIDFKGYLF